MRNAVAISLIFIIGALIGNKIGFVSGKRYAAEQHLQADLRYGCTMAQQAPNGECP